LDQHLNNDQIQELLSLAVSENGSRLDRRVVQTDVQDHLNACEECRSKLQASLARMQQFLVLGRAPERERGSLCPSEDVWVEVAAGLEGSHAETHLSHAVQCDYCGPLLKEAAETFDDGLTEAEESAIAHLQTSTPHWQRTFAAKLQHGNSTVEEKVGRASRSGWVWTKRLAFASVAAGLLVFCAWFGREVFARTQPARLIADAYTERRALEIRIEGAPYVRLTQERGGGNEQDRMNRPALLKAEAEIAQRLRSHPDDVRWLQASGRASLLEDDAASSEAAIGTLEKALRLVPNDRSISVDLASAYLLRGEFLNRKEDYGRAVEILGKTISVAAGDETAEFNYAIALERNQFKNDAKMAWEAFLKNYPNSPWKQEAQDHLARVLKEIRDQEGRSNAPLDTVEEAATAFETHNETEISKIDSRIEEYQDLAIQRWLPQLLVEGDERNRSAMRADTALHELAAFLADRHRDPWLMELLHADRSVPEVRQAIEKLSASTAEIETSDVSKARQDAFEAHSLFHRHQVPAGETRAQLVLILAHQYEHQDHPCESLAQEVQRNRAVTRYPWIFTQVLLEDSICASVSDRQALQAAESAMDLAKSHDYPILAMRAYSIESGLYSALGDPHRAWESSAKALNVFWGGPYPRLRGYNALILMDEINLPQEQWFLQTAILREAMPMVENDPRAMMVAVGQARLGQAFLRTGDFGEAERCYRTAQSLLNAAPQGMQREALKAEVGLGYAKVELMRGKPTVALELLEQLRPVLSRIPNDPLRLDFHQSVGMAELRAGHLPAAEIELRLAATLTEKGLSQLENQEDRWKWSHQNGAAYRALVEAELHDNPRQAFADWEWYKGAALRAQGPRIPNHSTGTAVFLPSADDKRLTFMDSGNGTALLSFVLFPNGYAIWVSNGSVLKEKWVPLKESDLSSQVAEFAEYCSDPHSDASRIRSEGGALYRELILPVEPWISGARHLVVEPDGALKGLPVGLLVDSQGVYLGDRYAVTVSPGMEYLNEARRWTGVSPASSAFILGDTKVPGWTPLPDASQEAYNVASEFSHPHLITEGTSSQWELSEKAAQADVFHFSGHAETSVASAGLVSASFGVLDKSQLDAFSRGRTELAVLSACSSARGTGGHFDDGDSMVRRLMGAHIPDVVASRWEVDSGSTAMLMKVFYFELLSGKPASDALGAAMRRVRGQPEYSHPYYWASFSVFGRS